MNIEELEIRVMNLEETARDGRKLLKVLKERLRNNPGSSLEKDDPVDVPKRRKTGYGKAAYSAILDDIKSAAEEGRLMKLHNGAAKIGHYRHGWSISKEDALAAILEVIDGVVDGKQRRRLRGIAEQAFIYGAKYPRSNSLDS